MEGFNGNSAPADGRQVGFLTVDTFRVGLHGNIKMGSGLGFSLLLLLLPIEKEKQRGQG